MQIQTTRTQTPKNKPQDESRLGFGRLYTDHMLTMDYEKETGWQPPQIVPYAPFLMDPASVVLHYGQSIFEGMKCFRGAGDTLRLFRPRDNFARMNRSAQRMCMPELPVDACLEGLYQLLRLEKEWVPSTPGTALYIRPTLIATDVTLSVSASKSYRFFIILSPSGAYYAEGLAPISIYVEDAYVRAVRGGIGFAKAAANYAASLFAGEEAAKQGYAQVLWLDGVEQRYVEEVGSMNIAFMMGGTMVTPALNGSILPGITRMSLLKMAESLGIPTLERRIAIEEIVEGLQDGTLTEAFGMGTAAVVAPVGTLCYRDTRFMVGNGGIGPVTQRLYDALTQLQRGLIPDPFDWTVTL